MSAPGTTPEDAQPTRSSGTGWTVAITLLLLANAVFAWVMLLRPSLEVDARPLDAVPVELGGWQGTSLPVDDAVADMLRADFNLQRAYTHPFGGLVFAYVGYYGTTRGGRPEHTPRMCYQAQGWEIVEDRTFAANPSIGLEVNEVVVQREGERRLVHFWYRTRRNTGLVAELALIVDHALGRLLDGRADGALVRLSTPIVGQDGLVAARSRLTEFGAHFERKLGDHWPIEQAPTDT